MQLDRLFLRARAAVHAARNYDVAADASRFSSLRNVTAVSRPAMVVVSNWLDEVRARMEER